MEPTDTEKSDQLLLVVDGRRLKKLDVRPTFAQYLSTLWARRHFIATDARFRAFRTTRDYRLWKFWVVAQPLLDALMYGLCFGLLLQTSRGIDNYIGFLLIGITFFNFMSKIVMSGAGLIRSSRNLLRAFDFPRAALVWSVSIRYLYDALPALLVSVTASIVMQLDNLPGISLLAVLPITVLMFFFATGLMLFVVRITAFVPDAKAILEILNKAWFFATGIFYSIDRFATHPTVHAVMSANPGHIYIDALRTAVLDGQAPDLKQWGLMLAWAIGALLAGMLFFWRAEEKYARVA
ncbi:ABC transporter permease [Corynebacterium lizhenjunii]|uniref:Transport permease protein n=1 Tax=Corynebacterium lizhenjunii TaxID=2709394 RepID=A0A7T0KEE1_9CORY|nr:ABC transporter permease [Corynebacterium lizhenjunii]QPK78594.1 ABC transporter permease [Corynebacterium lizhenjunii]